MVSAFQRRDHPKNDHPKNASSEYLSSGYSVNLPYKKGLPTLHPSTLCMPSHFV